MSFNFEPISLAQDVSLVTTFKIQIIILYFSITIPVKQISPQKHLGLILDSKLDFAGCF